MAKLVFGMNQSLDGYVGVKAERDGEIEVAGPALAHSLTGMA